MFKGLTLRRLYKSFGVKGLTGLLTAVANCCDRNQFIEKKNSICARRFEYEY
jgi:hypothetical protein